MEADELVTANNKVGLQRARDQKAIALKDYETAGQQMLVQYKKFVQVPEKSDADLLKVKNDWNCTCTYIPYPTLPYLTLPYLTLPYLTLPYLTLPLLYLLGFR